MDMKKLVDVTNRSGGWAGYVIPDSGVTRTFTPAETKRISIDELWQLQQSIPGGDYLIRNCFIIKDSETLDVLSMTDLEPEYFYTEKEVKKLLLEGTLEQLEDALNFGPSGVKDIIKNVAVQIELPDIRKRDLIFEKTGTNINNAINVNKIMNEETKTEGTEEKAKRKASPITVEDNKPVRKSTPVSTDDKYKVIS